MSVTEYGVNSPFAPEDLFAGEGESQVEPALGETLLTPFSEALAGSDELELEAEVAEMLVAELADEEFTESLEALVNEAAARQLRAGTTWTQQSEAPRLVSTEVEQWMESVAGQADRVLGELAEYFGDRAVDSVRDGEVEAAVSIGSGDGPLDAQELFLGGLIKKVGRAVRAVKKVATKAVKKGISALGKLGLRPILNRLRRLARSILKGVLDRAIGRLPRPLRPLARRLAKRFAREAEIGEYGGSANLAEAFDQQLAELLLAGTEAEAEQLLTEAESQAAQNGTGEPLSELDTARARLARELAEAAEDEPPTAAMERFIPAVMAAKPLIRVGIRIIGRKRVVNFIAGVLARLIRGMVGHRAARLLSRHIANTGLRLLGLEAEAADDETIGSEALVAAAEDTVRQVLSLPAESLADERVLEAEIQEAFAEAALRHLPGAVLRDDLVGESEDEHAMWVLMPRRTRPIFRYRKYGRILPVRITRSSARATELADGDTLEERLLEAGVTQWPVDGEMEVYELFDGSELGHLATFENEQTGDDPVGDTTEFQRLSESAATILAGDPRLAATGLASGREGSGRRYFRLRVAGRAVRRRRPFSVRLDLTSPQPALTVHLRIGERDAHTMAGLLERRQLVQVVSAVRGRTGSAMRRSLAAALARLLTKYGVQPPSGTARQAGLLADAMVRAVSKHLPEAVSTLAAAAKDPAAGLTLSFGFTFPSKAELATAEPLVPTLTIRPGQHHD